MPCLSFSGITFVLFCFLFVFLLSLKSPPFVQSFFVRRCVCAPIATRSYLTTVCALFCFSFFGFSSCLFGDVAFSEYFCTIAVSSWYGEYFVRFFLPDCVVFDLAPTGCFFYISVCENSINQSINPPITSITSHLPGIVSVHDQRRSAHVFCACAQSHGRLPDLNCLRSLDSWTV